MYSHKSAGTAAMTFAIKSLPTPLPSLHQYFDKNCHLTSTRQL